MKPESSRGNGKSNIVIRADNLSQENLKNERKTLQVLQQAAGKDKENLVGVSRSLRSNAKETVKELVDDKQLIIQEHLNNNAVANANKRQKKMSTAAKGKSKVTAEDLMSTEGPSDKYWSVIAEKRRVALEIALEENKQLHDKVKILEEENVTTKQLLEETNQVITVLREMVEGDETNIDFDLSTGSESIDVNPELASDHDTSM